MTPRLRNLQVRVGLWERNIAEDTTRVGYLLPNSPDRGIELKGSWARIQTILPLSFCHCVFLHNCCTELFSSSSPPFALSLVRAGVVHTNILFYKLVARVMLQG